MRARIPLRAALGAAIGLAFALPAQALSLQQAYEAALRNDPTYRMRIEENMASKEQAIVARAGLLPNVSASHSFSRNVADQETQRAGPIPGSIVTQTTHPRYLSRSTTVQLRQPILNLDAYYRYRQGKVQAQQSGEALEAGTDEVALRVARAYMDVLFAQDQVALSRVQRDMYREHRAVNQRLFEKGEGTRTDMLETQARYDLAEAQLIEAEDNLVAARDTLQGVIGMDPGNLDQLGENFRPLDLSPGSFEEWEKLALERNNTLAASRLAVENARLEIGRNRAGHAPRLDFIASYNKGDNESLNQFGTVSTNRQLGVQLNVPIYSGGAINASTRQAAATYARAQAERDVRTNDVLVELRKAHSIVQSSSRKIDALVKAVESAKLLMTATEQSIKGGVRINLDLLNAQDQLFTAQRDLAQARYGYLIGVLRLRAAAGMLDESVVRQVAAYFR
ncbi:type I secretion protein TolC [Massilia sp. KIM]|uniref:TolC family outer membrane protein n=1 Tax=Massilia sp. KIM TaxID=1955422 RepID=UPI00098F936C|nr:TolC family outer membrane protein [Massilia sp. KIM]OON60766.1 type I secretion protein TolC [Massilia sp. KIM]